MTRCLIPWFDGTIFLFLRGDFFKLIKKFQFWVCMRPQLTILASLICGLENPGSGKRQLERLV